MLLPKKERAPPTKVSLFLISIQHMGCQARKHSLHLPCTYNTMIREKAIFIKLNLLNFSDQQLFDHAVSGFKPFECSCPACGAIGHFREIGSYERDLVSAHNRIRIDTRLKIRRFQCQSCEHTHALLPDVLIPYGSYSLRFILIVLLDYLNRTGTVADLCQYWNIAISTLYDWIHLFINQYNSWCRVLDRILWVSRNSVSSIVQAPAFPSEFFSCFGFSFLQGRMTTPSGPVHLSDRRFRPCTT